MTAPAGETISARALLLESLCTASCLIAGGGEAVKCSCRCGGEYHAHLAGTLVPASQRVRAHLTERAADADHAPMFDLFDTPDATG